MQICWLLKQVKVKLSRYCHAGTKEKRRYSSYSFSTLALEGGEWSVSRPDRALPAEKYLSHPLDRRLGGP
jgi:hypothetical protein